MKTQQTPLVFIGASSRLASTSAITSCVGRVACYGSAAGFSHDSIRDWHISRGNTHPDPCLHRNKLR